MPASPFAGLWTPDIVNSHEQSEHSTDGYFVHPNLKENHSTDKPEEIGVLSKTLIRSPSIQWILPGRIRHRDKNDTLFIGGDYVQMRELLPHNHFHDVATKADFGSPIRAARVFGERKPLPDMLDRFTIPKREPSVDLQMMELDDVQSQLLPPQILALTLESQKLLFLFATETSSKQIDFICCTKELPSMDQSRSFSRLYGKHLAVDPKSRALAVAAQADFCGIFSLKPMDQLQDEMSTPNGMDYCKFKPILEEFFFRVEGVILRIEFLSAAAGEENTVNLVLLVSRKSRTFAHLYQWDTNARLRNVTAHHPQRLPDEERIPILLIPLNFNASFLIISEKTVAIFKDIALGPARRKGDGISRLGVNPSLFKSSRKNPLLTQWARPARHSHYTYDALYLCWEDGFVQLVLVKPLNEADPLEVIYNIGPLHGSIDTAFAVLDTGIPGGDDIIVACGDMSDVGVYAVKACRDPKALQALPNWGPMLDFAAVERVRKTAWKGENFLSPDLNRPARDRIFTISGRGDENGQVNEMRYGLEATIALITDENDDNSSLVQLWAMPDPQERDLFLFASLPWASFLMRISNDATEIDYDYGENARGFDMDHQTLAAGTTSEGIYIQITEHSIRATSMLSNGPRFSDHLPESTKITFATIHGHLSLFAALVQKESNDFLYCGRIRISNSEIGCLRLPPFTLSKSISCLSIESIGERAYILVGCTDASLQIVSISRAGLRLVLERDINVQSLGAQNSAIAALTIIRAGNRTSLLCGLRSGDLTYYEIGRGAEEASITLHQTSAMILGETTVSIRKDDGDESAAFITCGSEFWRLSYAPDPDVGQAVVESIYLTDQNEPYLLQDTINTSLRVPMFPYLGPNGLGGSLICAFGRSIGVCILDNTAKAVPRRLKIGMTPNKIVYAKHLNKLIVAGMSTSLRTRKDRLDQRSVVGKKRWLRPTLRMVDPDQPLPDDAFLAEADDEAQGIVEANNGDMPTGRAGETVCALLDWTPSLNGKTYLFVILGTKIQRVDKSPRGRLLTFSISDNGGGGGSPTITARNQMKHNHPVYAIAPWDEDALIYCAGKTMIMQRLDLDEGRWHHVASLDLQSPACAIATLEPFITVNTFTHSVFIFKFEHPTFEPFGADRQARNGQHLTILDPSTMLASDKECNVIGFAPPARLTVKWTAPTLFEAHLRTAATKLRPALIRPPWMVDRRAVLGSTVDGTLYQFTLLNRCEHLLLRFIQNMARRDLHACPFPPKFKALGHVDPSEQRGPLYKHVDGDVLGRVVDLGVKHLREMISRPTKSDNIQQDFDTVEDRLRRFYALAAAVVGDVSDEEKFGAVMGWMRNHLHPML